MRLDHQISLSHQAGGLQHPLGHDALIACPHWVCLRVQEDLNPRRAKSRPQKHPQHRSSHGGRQAAHRSQSLPPGHGEPAHPNGQQQQETADHQQLDHALQKGCHHTDRRQRDTARHGGQQALPALPPTGIQPEGVGRRIEQHHIPGEVGGIVDIGGEMQGQDPSRHRTDVHPFGPAQQPGDVQKVASNQRGSPSHR